MQKTWKFNSGLENAGVDPTKLCFSSFSVKLLSLSVTNNNRFIYYEKAKLNSKKRKNYEFTKKKTLVGRETQPIGHSIEIPASGISTPGFRLYLRGLRSPKNRYFTL